MADINGEITIPFPEQMAAAQADPDFEAGGETTMEDKMIEFGLMKQPGSFDCPPLTFAVSPAHG
jgi:hypothetical protein